MAPHVVYALPRHTMARVLGAAGEPLAYAPWVVSNVRVTGPPRGAAWDNVAYDERPDETDTYSFSRAALGFVVSTHRPPTASVKNSHARSRTAEVPWDR